MRKLAILSTDDLEDFFVYDHLAYTPLNHYGWQVEEVSWHNSEVNWDQFDVVVIRSTWDYQNDSDNFLEVLKSISSSKAKLENSLSLVSWNISKGYLQDLQTKGVKIVPTLWFDSLKLDDMRAAFGQFGSKEIVIKPLVSANADHTYRLRPSDLDTERDGLEDVFTQRPHLVQPFLNGIVNEGEYSLFYFSGEYSHAILKVPKHNDFRVQEEHGGQLRSVEPEPILQHISEQVLAALPEIPLYARIDLVKNAKDYVVMEVELIEPSLYFNMDVGSAQRFADAFVSRYGRGNND